MNGLTHWSCRLPRRKGEGDRCVRKSKRFDGNTLSSEPTKSSFQPRGLRFAQLHDGRAPIAIFRVVKTERDYRRMFRQN